MDLGLKDAHVLITGASGGIGLATAEIFLQQGAKVTAHYNLNSKPLEPLVEQHEATKIRGISADLSKEDDVVRLFSEAAANFGPVQVVVINHAISRSEQPLVDMSLERWKTVLDVNLTSSFLVAREYLRGLRNASEDLKNSASIIFIGSTAGKYGEAGNADYAASKSALMYGMTNSLKNEIVKIAPKARVNCIAPGWVRTAMAEEALRKPEIIYRAMATTPLKKIAEPIDIANQIAVIASPLLSGHVTGEVVMVAGGMEGRLLNKQEEINI